MTTPIAEDFNRDNMCWWSPVVGWLGTSFVLVLGSAQWFVTVGLLGIVGETNLTVNLMLVGVPLGVLTHLFLIIPMALALWRRRYVRLMTVLVLGPAQMVTCPTLSFILGLFLSP